MIELTERDRRDLLRGLTMIAESLDPLGVVAVQHRNVMLSAECFREMFLNKVWSVVEHEQYVTARLELDGVVFWGSLSSGYYPEQSGG